MRTQLNFLIISTILLVAVKINSINGYTLSSTNCPTSCTCTLASNTLTISGCSQTSATFSLPSNFVSDPQLSSVTSIVASGCLIQSFPSNICSYPSVTSLDLSTNQITSLTNSNLNCLPSLSNLKLDNNLISSISSDAFNGLTNLNFLYLSNNKISQIPQGLFNTGLANLLSIDLSYNLLTTMELWPTYLPKVFFVNLKNNAIQYFSNSFGWFLYQNYPAFTSTATIDMRNNLISSLSDVQIQQYGVCSYNDYVSFITKYFNVFWIDNNPIVCSCSNSQRLVTDSIVLLASNNALTLSNLYKSYCLTPSAYSGKHVLSFDVCSSSINYPYCVNSTATTTVATTTFENITVTAGFLGGTTSAPLSGGAIAGIVIGILFALFVLLFILLCIFQTELIACCFFNCNCCYMCLSDCRKTKKTEAFSNDMSKKFFGAFVSYNPKNTNSMKWIENKLMPSLHVSDPAMKYFLHYGKENIEGHTFSPLIHEKLENTAHLILVLSDEFLDNEWNNMEFRTKIRTLIQNRKMEITCVQMIDVTDEEVEEFVRNEIQETNLRSFEVDECCFWTKLKYFIFRYRNPNVSGDYIKITKGEDAGELISRKRKTKPVDKEPKKVETPVQQITIRPDSAVQFPDWNIKGPGIHLYDSNEASNRIQEIGVRHKKVAKDLENLHEELNVGTRQDTRFMRENITEATEETEKPKKQKHHKKHKSHKKSRRHEERQNDGDGQQSQVSASHVRPDTAPYVVKQNVDQYNMLPKSNKPEYDRNYD